MSSQSHLSPPPRQALVLVPVGINPLHDLQGRRLAETLRSLGWSVDVRNLNGKIEDNYDLCLLTNVSDALLSDGSGGNRTAPISSTEGKEAALAAIQRLRPCCRFIAGCLLDGSDRSTYGDLYRLCQAAGIDNILDFGFCDASAAFAPSAGTLYHFILNGLSPSEREAVSHEKSEEERSIPWAFIGHASVHHVALVNQLVVRVDPRGFVYMPNLDKATAHVSHPLNQRQYESVLRNCRYHLWYSDRSHFCLESERFRLSLLAGCVPIKVVSEDQDRPSHLPFDYLVLRESDAAERMRQFNFHELRRRFRADFLTLPSLAEGLAKFLRSRSLLPDLQAPAVQSQAA